MEYARGKVREAWFDADYVYDATFEEYADTIKPWDWIVAINGGPFTDVSEVCKRNRNTVVVSMAFSSDTSKNIFGQNTNCLFDAEASANVVGHGQAPSQSAYISLNVDTKFVKTFGPRFLGRTPQSRLRYSIET